MNTDELFKLADAVAKELDKIGSNFRARREESGRVQILIEGVVDPTFAFTLDMPEYGDHRGRLVVRGRYNGLREFMNVGDTTVSGTFAPTTPPQKIARRIMTGLYPEYVRQINQAKARRAEHLGDVAAVQSAATELESIGFRRFGDSRLDGDRVQLWKKDLDAELVVCADRGKPHVNLKADNLTIEEARQILELLKK